MPDEEEDLREEIDSLKKQLNSMEGMLKNIMDMHKNLLERVSMNSDVEQRYVKMLSLYQRFGKISPSALPGIDDSISEAIVEILLDAPALNITQITERLREKKGSASRHTVRERLKEMEEKGIVKKEDSGQGKSYSLTGRIIDKWAKLLGFKV
ncbi:MAG: winged helix-turn-helix domain-containing protein [Thermoplasmata archaeon]